MYVKRKDYRMRITTAKLLAAALAAALFAMTFCFSSAWGSSENQKELESSDPVFTQIDCETFDGERFTAADLKDAKLTVFNVWETTCPACLGEMPDLEKLLKKHGTDDFQLVGVCADLYDKDGDLKAQRLEKAKGQMEKAGATFPHIIPDELG